MPGHLESLPHPEEILSIPGYDPTEHIIAKSVAPCIASVPSRSDILIRWTPHNISSVLSLASTIEPFKPGKNSYPSSLSVQQLTGIHTIQMRELGKLQRRGIEVVEHVTTVSNRNPSRIRGGAIVSIVRRLEGQLLTHDDPRGFPTLRGLLGYMVDAQPGAFYMSDVAKPQQYTISPEPDAVPVLHDIEPSIERVRLQIGDGHYRHATTRLWVEAMAAASPD